MEYNLKVINFQSLKNIDIKIGGVTVVHSKKSNMGKSSFVRVLGMLLFGFNIKDPITYGENKMYIGLKWSGHSIEWIKGKGLNDYKIDGQEYSKVGTNVPEDIERLGFYKLVFGDMSLVAQIRKQFDKAWPLNLNAPELGKVVGSLVQTENIYQAIKGLLSDSGRLRNKANKCDTEISVKGKEIARLHELDKMNSMLEAIDIIEYTEEEEKITKAEEAFINIKSTSDELLKYNELEKIRIPDKEDTEKDVQAFKLISCIEIVEKSLGALSKVPDIRIPNVGVVNKCEKVVALIDSVTRCQDRLKRIHGVAEIKIEDAKNIKIIEEVTTAINRIELIDKALQEIDEEKVKLDKDMEEAGVEICNECGGKGISIK